MGRSTDKPKAAHNRKRYDDRPNGKKPKKIWTYTNPFPKELAQQDHQQSLFRKAKLRGRK